MMKSRAEMLTLTEMRELKRQFGMTNEDVAEMTGVALSTVQKVFGGTVKAPRRGTLEKLSEGFEKLSEGFEKRASLEGGKSGMVRETAFQYAVEQKHMGRRPEAVEPDRYGGRGKGQGEYTMEDYYAWPEEERVELIDGRIYNMTAPYVNHQAIIMGILRQLFACQERNGEDCLILVSPVDVQLDMDDRTMVQPDIVILCDLEKNINRCIYGAPDFVLEVLSPSTRLKDRVLKLHKYYAAGCREYWTVDPETMEVSVYDFEHEELNVRYTFDDQIPVRISGGGCVIDFTQIRDNLKRIAPNTDKP